MKKLIVFSFMLFSLNNFAQKLDSTALILIDIQKFYFPGGDAALVEPEAAALEAQKVLEYFRENKGLVVHVKHAYEPGGEIHPLVKPIDGEQVFTKSEVNCFLGTGLDEFLKEKAIKYVVLAGMQTHMCLEGGTRAAHDLGYKCTVVENACATRDLKYGDTVIKAADVHASTLATLKSYAKIVTAEEFVK